MEFKSEKFLTGRWHLKRTWYGRYKVMVEVSIKMLCAFSMGERSILKYRKATKAEIKRLGIKIK